MPGTVWVGEYYFLVLLYRLKEEEVLVYLYIFYTTL